jgi:hypothetical protein
MVKKKAQQGKGKSANAATLKCKEEDAKQEEVGEEEEEEESDDGDEISVELELDSEGRIAGTLESGIDLSPFRAWHGNFAQNSDVEELIRTDSDRLWGIEETHGSSFFVPADWDSKKVKKITTLPSQNLLAGKISL